MAFDLGTAYGKIEIDASSVANDLARIGRSFKSSFKNINKMAKSHLSNLGDEFDDMQTDLNRSIDAINLENMAIRLHHQKIAWGQHIDEMREKMDGLPPDVLEAVQNMERHIERGMRNVKDMRHALNRETQSPTTFDTGIEDLSLEPTEDEVRQLNRALDNSGRQVGFLTRSLEGLRGTGVTAFNALRSVSRRTFSGLRSLVTGVADQLQLTIRRVSRLTQEAFRLGRQVGDSLDEIGQGISQIGFVVTAVSSAAMELTRQSINAFGDFESAFTGVRKTVNATAEEYEQLEAAISEMATSNTSLTAGIPDAHEQLSRIMELAGQMGVEGVANLEEFTETVALLRITTDVISDESTMRLAQIMEIMRTPHSEVDRLGSTLVALGNNLPTTENQIVEMSQRLAGMANFANLTDAELMALSATLSSVGMRADAGGSSMSRVLREMVTAARQGSPELAKFAEVAGLTQRQMANMIQGSPAEAVEHFLNGLFSMIMTGQDATGVLADLGLDTIRLERTLLNAAGAGDLFSRSLELANDGWEENIALTEEARKRAEDQTFAINRLNNQFFQLRVEIGDILAPSVALLLDRLSALIEQARVWIQANRALVEQLAKTSVMFTMLGGGLIGFGQLVSGVGSILQGLFGVFLVLLNPMSWLMLAITALASAFVDWQRVAESTMNISNIVFDGFVNGASITETWLNVVRELQIAFPRLAMMINQAYVFMRPVLDFIFDLFQDLLSGRIFGTSIGDFIDHPIFVFFNYLISTFPNFVRQNDELILAIISFLSVLGDGFSFALDELGKFRDWFLSDGLPAIISFITNTFLPTLSWLISTAMDVWRTVSPYLYSFLDWWIETGAPAIEAFIQNVLIPVLREVINYLMAVWQEVSPYLNSLLQWFINTGGPLIWRFIVDVLVPGIIMLIRFLNNTWFATKGALNSLHHWWTQGGGRGIQQFLVNEAIPATADFTRGMIDVWQQSKPYLVDMAQWLGNVFLNTLDAIGRAIRVIGDSLGWLRENFVAPDIAGWEQLNRVISEIVNGLQWMTNSFVAPSWFPSGTQNSRGPVEGVLDSLDQGIESSGLGNAIRSLGSWIRGIGTRDSGGIGRAGTPYLIGRKAQPELFVPSTNGQFFPNADEMFTPQQPSISIGAVNIHANSQSEGREAARGFETELRDRMYARGFRGGGI